MRNDNDSVEWKVDKDSKQSYYCNCLCLSYVPSVLLYTRIVQDHSDIQIQQYIAARENVLEQIQAFMDEYLTGPKSDQPIIIKWISKTWIL